MSSPPPLGGVVTSASCKICRSSGNKGVGIPLCSTFRPPRPQWLLGPRPPSGQPSPEVAPLYSTSGEPPVLSSHSSRCVSDVFGPSQISEHGGSGSSAPFLCGSNLTSSSSVESLECHRPLTGSSCSSLHFINSKSLSVSPEFNPGHGTNCNGYGIWINNDKLRYDLIMFNRLLEPWRASPESWHLSRIYHIHSIITFTQVENIS